MLEKTLALHSDERGDLVVVNQATTLCPFEIKRVFWVYLPAKGRRGNHYHKKCTQAMVVLDGVVNVRVSDEWFLMSEPDKLLIIPPFHCVEYVNESPVYGAIVLVLCSEYYDPNDVFPCVE